MRACFGILIGCFFILRGMALEGGHLSSIVQVTGFLIVAGGAFGALIVAYPWQDVLDSVLLALTGREASRSRYAEAASPRNE